MKNKREQTTATNINVNDIVVEYVEVIVN